MPSASHCPCPMSFGSMISQCYPSVSAALLLSLTIQTLVPHPGIPTRSMSYVHSTFKVSVHISRALPCPSSLCLALRWEKSSWHPTSFVRAICIFRSRCDRWSISSVSQREVKTLRWCEGKWLGLGRSHEDLSHSHPQSYFKLFLSREKGNAPGNLTLGLWFPLLPLNSPTPFARKKEWNIFSRFI